MMLFDPLRDEVEQLIGLLGVDGQAATILAAFDALCADSLRIEPRQCAPELSRINVDGTPFQFSLSLSDRRRPALQFLAEAGRPGCESAQRLSTGRAVLTRLAELCGALDEADAVQRVLNVAAPENDRDLLADRSGVFWFALRFETAMPPALTIYVNGRWGSEESQWHRLDAFTDSFESRETWRTVRSIAPAGLAPLGVAITVKAGAPPRGRVYLSAYGVPMASYRSLFVATANDGGAEHAFDRFVRHVIAEDAEYPTRSAVFSVELSPETRAAPKLEVCAHCAFNHDVHAAERISRWLRTSHLDDELYRSVLETVAAGRALSCRAYPSVHAYVGVGARGVDTYASIYLNPGPGLACS